MVSTAQGERYGRYVGWIGSDLGTYDGNQIAAAEAITGETGLTQDAALHRICASLLTEPYDTKRPLMDYMAGAAGVLGVPGGWDSVGNELPVSKPLWPPAVADLSIAALDADKLEGDSGSTPFTFTVTRAANTTFTTTVNYAVSGTTATLPAAADAADFVGGVFPSGVVTFLDGESSQTLTINVQGDLTVEPDEEFTVTLSGASGGATISQATAQGFIRNED